MGEFPRVWLFDINRRVYGPGSHSPIWRGHWCEHEVVGETRVSWITSWGKRVPKKGGSGIAFSLEEIEQAEWAKDNAYRIAGEVGRLEYAKLRAVADLIGYKEAK